MEYYTLIIFFRFFLRYIIMCTSAEKIKAFVIDWLLSQYEGIIIGNEVMYGSSRKVVDLLAIVDNKTIAIEIKSAADKLSRLPEQIAEYNKVFDKVMVIAAAPHIEDILRILPKGTGLYSLENEKISKIAQMLVNHNQDKLELLNSISSAYLKKLYPQYRDFNANKIRLILSKKKKADIQQLLVTFYQQRISEKFQLFLNDRGTQTLVDDIPTLSTFTLIDQF